jgi:hypothetical protein
MRNTTKNRSVDACSSGQGFYPGAPEFKVGAFKIIIFRDLTPYSRLKADRRSEEHIASIIKVEE